MRIGHPAVARLMAEGPEVVPVIRFGVLLHKQGQEFYQNMAREFRTAVAQLPGVKGQLILEFSASQAPSEVAGLLRGMAGRCDVIAATAVNHPEITAAVEELRAGGLPVFSLLSDFAQGVRAGYVGLNNLKVGRTAAWMISLSAKGPGKVALFVGGARWHGHDLRETGFRAYLREERPDYVVVYGWTSLLYLLAWWRRVVPFKLVFVCALDAEIDGEFRRRHPVRGALFERGMRAADARLSITAAQAENFARKFMSCTVTRLLLAQEAVLAEVASKRES